MDMQLLADYSRGDDQVLITTAQRPQTKAYYFQQQIERVWSLST